MARRAQIRLEGRLPSISAVRRNLAARAERPYASHLPILLGLQQIRPVRAVLELGAGDFSTGAFLDRRCFPALERLTSVEVNGEWRAKIDAELAADPRLSLLGAGSATTSEAVATIDIETYDVVFIDDSDRAPDRAASIATVVDKAPRLPIVVVHDFEVPDYRWATAPFDHAFLFSTYNPMTGVCWNGAPARSKELASLAKVIDRHHEEVAPDDRGGWVRAFEARTR